MKYYFLLILMLLIGLTTSIWLNPPVSLKSAEKIHDDVVTMRNYGIELAQANGEYKCCIDPVCTMCYMEGNKWNYNQPGKCFCDDFVARGEDPCPQCERGLWEDTGSSCEILSENCEGEI